MRSTVKNSDPDVPYKDKVPERGKIGIRPDREPDPKDNI